MKGEVEGYERKGKRREKEVMKDEEKRRGVPRGSEGVAIRGVGREDDSNAGELLSDGVDSIHWGDLTMGADTITHD